MQAADDAEGDRRREVAGEQERVAEGDDVLAGGEVVGVTELRVR